MKDDRQQMTEDIEIQRISNIARANEFALLVAPDDKRYLVRLTPSQQLHTHHGFIPHNAMIGQPFGSTVKTQLGYSYLLFQPSTFDLVTRIKRSSQIIYPKEIGYILLKMNIVPGSRVVEAGTGSGGLTLALSRFVRPNGRIYTYEERDDMIEVARKNLDKVGALDVVELKQRDIRDGFDERGVDALFLDVREPWLFLSQARAALKSGGFFGSLVPTTNQLSEILQEMERLGGWADIEVVEILMRHYKPNADRLRPEDRMIAHTGYLLFARTVAKLTEDTKIAKEIESVAAMEETTEDQSSGDMESEELNGEG
jgi:tRNA (adenine57-N1/adenine58-N1)-methyltransferase